MDMMTRRAIKSLSSSIELDLSSRVCGVLANSLQLEQALVNVISNALESRSGGTRVEVRSVVEGDFIAFVVKDDWVGIEPRQLKH